MKTIYRIAKAELSLLFYSPIAWFLLVIFTIQSGLAFTDTLKEWIHMQEEYGDPYAIRYGGLTHILYSSSGVTLFYSIQASLYLYIPLLSMGLMSREISSGSIKLLLSSPVKTSQIIWGKFAAMLTYCLILILILFLFSLTGALAVKDFDFNMTLSGLLITYLIICTYSAIGLFMSSLTQYQVVAALSTIAVLFALNYVGNLWQNIALVRAITYFLTFQNRAGAFNDGLISSADVIYFLLLIGLFLMLTTMRIDNGKRFRPLYVRVIRYSFLVAVFLILGYCSSLPRLTAYYDATNVKRMTLSPNSQEVIKKITDPLKVTAYVNLLDDHASFGLPESKNNDKYFWQFYTRFMPDMQFKYVYYYDTSKSRMFNLKENNGLSLEQLAMKAAKSYGYNMDMFLRQGEVNKQVNLEGEDNRFVRQLVTGSKKSMLRVFDDYTLMGQPTEYEIMGAMKQLVARPPKLLFVNGHFERSLLKEDEVHYKSAFNAPENRRSLLNHGFISDSISLEEKEIPKDIAALVITDPKIAFTTKEMDKINRYLDGGGNMVIAAEPARRDIYSLLLKRVGVSLMDGHLVEISKAFGPDRLRAKFSDNIGTIFNRNKLKAWGQDSLNRVFLSGAAGLEYNSDIFSFQPLLRTDEKNAWIKTGSFSSDTSKLMFNPEAGDKRQSVPVAIAGTRKIAGREQRIVVIGDADLMSNELGGYDGNLAFLEQMFAWLTYKEFPVDTDIATIDNDFKVTRNFVPPVKIIFLFIIPGLLLVWCAVFLIRRKRK